MMSDVHDMQYLIQGCVKLVDDAIVQLGIQRMGQLSGPVLNKLKKDDLVKMLHSTLRYLNEFAALTTDFTNTSTSMKTQFIESQQKIIELQSELLNCKDKQLESVNCAVKSSVKESIETEIKTYSSVVQKNRSEDKNKLISAEDVRNAVQSAVQAEDRSKNMMIFGLPENADEDINAVVSDVFQTIDEKPRVEVCRVGLKKTDKSARPVKVTTTCSAVVDQILYKARRLKQVDRYKNVFLCPDRSPEQRAQQRELIKRLKNKLIEEPDKKHFIRNDEIHSVDKNST